MTSIALLKNIALDVKYISLLRMINVSKYIVEKRLNKYHPSQAFRLLKGTHSPSYFIKRDNFERETLLLLQSLIVIS